MRSQWQQYVLTSSPFATRRCGTEIVRYCDKVLRTKDHETALHGEDAAAHIKGFFDWIIQNARRPPQTDTLRQYFRVLKMTFCERDPAGPDEGLVQDVNNVGAVGRSLWRQEMLTLFATATVP